MKAEHGFTLLEILAALAIAAVGIAAVVSTTNSAINVLQSTENRSLATWAASNRLAELQVSRDWPTTATRDLSTEMGGRTWHYREQISGTSDPDLLRVDLSVYSDEEQTRLEAELFGYLAKYSAPSGPVAIEQDDQPQQDTQSDEPVPEEETGTAQLEQPDTTEGGTQEQAEQSQ